MTPAAALDVHVVADSDTRWKWGAALARQLTPGRAVRVHSTLLEGRSTPSARQLSETGFVTDSMRRAGIADIVADPSVNSADIVILACVGGAVQALLRAFATSWSVGAKRPVVVTGYVGLVYEHTVDGLLLRAGADVVLANSARDAARFRKILLAVDADPASIVQTSLPFLDGRRHDPTAAGRSRLFTVTFVAQPGVPATREERRYAMGQVITHAQRHPERRVVVKLRGRPGERTTHVEPHHYTSVLPTNPLPDNVELAYGSMSDVLDRTDLCVTVSSTAAVEAMHRGIPTAILTDFGIRESLGNHLFLTCGAYASWTALHDGAIPTADPRWKRDNGVLDPDPYRAAAERVNELLDAPTGRPPLRPWLNIDDNAGYLPALLAKYGVDVQGVPLTRAVTLPASAPWPRRATRSAARRAYRLGVRTLEPRIRRWAAL